MAAGVSLAPDKLEAFRGRLNEIAGRALRGDQLLPPLRIDSTVSLGQLTFERLRELQKLEQCGTGNPPVQFVAHGLHQPRPLQRFGTDKRHVRLWASDGETTREAVWWGAGELALPVGNFDLAFAPVLSEYNGLFSIQLKVLDWRPV
jgi:single-stranded-DNA-specific exonuclease